MRRIAIGTWSWGVGGVGGDEIFGNHLDVKDLRMVYKTAIDNDLNLFDTAFVYGMGDSERILGTLNKEFGKDVTISTKFTPQCAPMFNNSVEAMCDNSLKLLNIDSIDI